jgi:multiple sugar transport system ATP-binding protein
MVRNPEIFLLDEPLSNLDAALRTEMRSNIMKLHKKLGATFIYVTHDQTEAMTMANRIVVMNKGKIEQSDTPERIYKSPANKFVAEFIGTPKMNMIYAKLSKENGQYHLLIGKSKFRIPENRFGSEILDNFLNKEVIAGFRPEDVKTSETYAEQALVELVETTGPETFIHINFENNMLISRQSGIIDVPVGKTTGIRLNMDHVHIFDSDTGMNLVPLNDTRD